MIGEDGLVFDKSFFAEHGARESINDMLQESYRVRDLERGEIQIVTTPLLSARAYFASPTIRPRQLTVLTVEGSVTDGVHINGRSVLEGYIPVELSLNTGDLVLERVDYPEPEEMYLEPLGETLPVYSGDFVVKAYCMGVRRDQVGEFEVAAKLRYQACDERECYLPQTLTFPLHLRYLQHVR